MSLGKQELISQIRNAGVPEGALLHLKVSMRAIGEVENGAQDLLEALLEVVGANGTLVSDAFVESFPLPLSDADSAKVSTTHSPSYAGLFANAMVQHNAMVRSKHPIQRFVAIGAMAEELMLSHTHEKSGYHVLEQMSTMNALNLTIGRDVNGVGTTHVAIEKSGLKRKLPSRGVNYLADDGNIKLFKVNWSGGCANGFKNFIPMYESAGIVKHGSIGKARTILTSMQKTLELEMEILKENPSFFFCNDPTCKDCRLRWEHSTGSYLAVKYHSALRILGITD